MDMPNGWGETQEALTLHKELQATEDSWEQERGCSPEKSTPIVPSAKQSPKTYIQVTFYDQTGYILEYIYVHALAISKKNKKRGHEFEGHLGGTYEEGVKEEREWINVVIILQSQI